MTIYRLNRVPDKLHVALLDLLGIQLDGPSAARTDVRFRLASAPEEPVEIPGGQDRDRHAAHAERGVDRLPGRRRLRDPGDAPVRLRRAARQPDQGRRPRRRQARPQGADQLPFGAPPSVGDALYLGFDEPIGRLLIEVEVDASQARGAGVNPEDPPLRWEVSQGDNGWAEAEVLEDLTGGFNYGSGTVELQLPERSAIQSLGGHRMHWLRCRIDDKTRHGGAATTYSHPPEIYSITAVPIGALLPATHASRVEDELLGLSDGTPGQVFPLRHNPVLKPGVGRDARGAGPGVGRLVDLGAPRGLRRLDRVRPPLRARPRLGRGRGRPRDPRDRRRLDPVRRRAAEGRGAALLALPPRRRAARQHHRRRALGAAQRDPRHRHGQQPAVRRPAASTPRRSSTRASARRWRSARATGPSRRRTSSSSPARRRRAWRVRSASRPTTAARCRCTSCRTCSRPTASSPTPSWSPRTS